MHKLSQESKAMIRMARKYDLKTDTPLTKKKN